MAKKMEEPFKGPIWTEYQNVKVTNITVPPSEKTKEDIKWFKEYIKEQMKKKDSTK